MWAQRPFSPAAQAGHGGSTPRAAQPSTGSSTTRAPSSSAPTTSWPGTKGKLTMGSNRTATTVPPPWPGRSRRCRPARDAPGASPWNPRAASGRACPPGPGGRAGRRRRRSGCRPPGRRRSGAATGRSAAPSCGQALTFSRSPMGSRGRGPPGAFFQCSTCQPRRRATVASFGSGFTATGKPTDSSMGRSEAESA